jgi:hypothetical protein
MCSLSYRVCYIQQVGIIVISVRDNSCLFILSSDQLEGQRFNLKWENLNQKLSKLPLTLFVLY